MKFARSAKLLNYLIMALSEKQQQYEAFINDCKEKIANRVINCDNYYLSTKVRFHAICSAYDVCNDCSLGIAGVDKVWAEMKKQGFEHTISPKSSGSEYLVDRKNGIVYRKSDHWGRCATCNWSIDFDYKGIYAIAKASVSDFENIMTLMQCVMLTRTNSFK